MFSNHSQSNITVSLSTHTPNPHDSKQTVPTAELSICKGLKKVNCNFREFVHVAALPAVGRWPTSDVGPREHALLWAATAAQGTAQRIWQDPSAPTASKLLIHTHHPWSTTQALVEINRNVFLAPGTSSVQSRPNLTEISGVRNSRLISAPLRVPEDAENVNENRTTSSREEY